MDVVSPPNGGQMSIDSNSGSLRYVDSGRIVNGDTSNDTSNGFSNQPMAHLQDLHDEASRGLDKDHSITSMIDLANECLLRAQQLLGYRRPEQAYMYYIRCYQILVDTIYRNAAFPDLKSSKPERWAAYNKLVKVCTCDWRSFKGLATNSAICLASICRRIPVHKGQGDHRA